MNSLFEDSGAEFSNCGKYRYALWRIWDSTKPLVMYIGLNPSVADAYRDDPTIRRVRDFTNRFGFGGFYMMNLFAWITPYPEELKLSSNLIGENDTWLKNVSLKCEKIVFAWGSANVSNRSNEIIKMFPDAFCLGKTKNGSPKHPLYLKKETQLVKV